MSFNLESANIEAIIDATPPIDAWPEIISLEANSGTETPYPLEALPEIAARAVREYQLYGQQPVSMVACSALSAMCFATQGLANVARDKILTSPLSLNIMVVAESGERKSAADKIFGREARAWEREQTDQRQEETQAADDAIAIFAEKEKALLQTIRKCADKSSKRDELSAAEHALTELRRDKPTPRPPFQALFEDVNQQTLAVALTNGHPVAGLISDEAGIIVGGNGMNHENAMQFFAFINRMWDGESYRRNRLTTQGADIVGRRLNCSLMMQSTILKELLRIKDGQSRGTGFLARSLFTQPPSTKGTRLYKESPGIAFMEPFNRRIRQLLETPLPIEDEQTQRLKPPILELSAQAKAAWVAYHDQVEMQLGASGIFSSVDDFASKSAENAARIAGVFHVFEHGAAGEIDDETMSRAIDIASWHLGETLRVFSVMETPEPLYNAMVILKWLLSHNLDEFTTAKLSQGVPKKGNLRHKEKWWPALNLLCEHGYAVPDPNQATLYRLNPKARGIA